MRDRINRDMTEYFNLGDDKEMATQADEKQTLLQLLIFKYNSMCKNKKIIQANHEFLNMARVILKEEQPDSPIQGVLGLIKLQTYD